MKSKDIVVALAGNPNVGKSTVFNGLTGLNQHTGNWAGKTVSVAKGAYFYNNKKFILVDLPGTYSLLSNSIDEEVARDFICFEKPDVVIVVVDATCLERNLNLVLQIIEITSNVVVCVNLMDEARKKKIVVNLQKLSKILGVPVVGTSASIKEGLNQLMEAVDKMLVNNPKEVIKIKYDDNIEKEIKDIQKELTIIKNINARWLALRLLEGEDSFIKTFEKNESYKLLKCVKESQRRLRNVGIDKDEFRDKIVSGIVRRAENISEKVVIKNEKYYQRDYKIDKIITSKLFGIPLMMMLLGIIFYITIIGANVPSKILANILFQGEEYLSQIFERLNVPLWLHGMVVHGMYRTLAWVVSVMLPPMAIFFPLFTILEDLGYLPRVAFNLDKLFKKVSACGKQALTMCMGFGCNAAGVIGCRIINSPRERLIAIITNNFVPCNGRFPTLIAIITMFFVGVISSPLQPLFSAFLLTLIIILGVMMTLFVSKVLSKTILKGLPSNFVLELPPYRKPQIRRIIIRSILDRTLFVLGRAVIVAMPAGLIIWIMANVKISDVSLLTHFATFLNPFANLIGLDGYILMSFILGFPANEIVIPLIIMSYMSSSTMLELSSLAELKTLLIDNGWTWLTAICVMLFSLMHWPCGTTYLTIRKETQSWKWTLVSFLVPTIMGIISCFVVTSFVRLFGFL